ncbi:hypothetical protein H4R33_005343 [Dimargaris cristalligena]|nr:hypothetical protein H4R33_005343 [Dimargaris cristalligena]
MHVAALSRWAALLFTLALVVTTPTKANNNNSHNNSPAVVESVVARTPVIDMTDANYADLLATRDEWILDFYATWCGACQQFAPKLKLLSERLADADMPHVGIAKIEIDANPELAARFMITRLPTLFYLRHNEIRTYEGPLDAYHVFEFVQTEWKSVAVWDGPFSPFSNFGMVIGKIAGTGCRVADLLRQVPVWAYIALFFSLPVGAYLMLVRSGPTHARISSTKTKKQN